MNPDPRLNAYRPDIARASLSGKVIAERYAKGDLRRVDAARLGMYGRPRGAGPMVSEALRGEDFLVLDVAGRWAWGQLARDDYVGYVRADHLAPIETASTHRRIGALEPHFFRARSEERAVRDPCGSTRWSR